MWRTSVVCVVGLFAGCECYCLMYLYSRRSLTVVLHDALPHSLPTSLIPLITGYVSGFRPQLFCFGGRVFQPHRFGNTISTDEVFALTFDEHTINYSGGNRSPAASPPRPASPYEPITGAGATAVIVELRTRSSDDAKSSVVFSPLARPISPLSHSHAHAHPLPPPRPPPSHHANGVIKSTPVHSHHSHSHHSHHKKSRPISDDKSDTPPPASAATANSAGGDSKSTAPPPQPAVSPGTYWLLRNDLRTSCDQMIGGAVLFCPGGGSDTGNGAARTLAPPQLTAGAANGGPSTPVRSPSPASTSSSPVPPPLPSAASWSPHLIMFGGTEGAAFGEYPVVRVDYVNCRFFQRQFLAQHPHRGAIPGRTPVPVPPPPSVAQLRSSASSSSIMDSSESESECAPKPTPGPDGTIPYNPLRPPPQNARRPWLLANPLRLARSHFGSCVVTTKNPDGSESVFVYVFGGRMKQDTPLLSVAGVRLPMASVESWPVSDWARTARGRAKLKVKWKLQRPMPEERAGCSAVVVPASVEGGGPRVVIVGGESTGLILDTALVYDVITNSYIADSVHGIQPLSHARSYGAAVCVTVGLAPSGSRFVNGSDDAKSEPRTVIVAIGGRNFTAALSSVEMCILPSPAAATAAPSQAVVWRALPDLSIPRFEFACTAVGTLIVVMGGRTSVRTSELTDRVECLDVESPNPRWTQLPPMPHPRAGFAVVGVTDM